MGIQDIGLKCRNLFFGQTVIKVYSPETGKTLKKLYKHMWKKYKNHPVMIYAFVESEDGEVHEVSEYWQCEWQEEYWENTGKEADPEYMIFARRTA